jgi:hypothetical protein
MAVGALAGSFVAAALLLGAGGAFEVWRPAATVGALRALGVPASPPVVRGGGVLAVIVSAGSVVSLSRPSALALSVFYLLLAGFVVVALTRGVPLRSCGCFGRDDTPPTATHVVVDLAAAVVAALVALAPGSRGWASVGLDGDVLVVALFVVLTAAATAFAYLALTLVPRLTAAGDHGAKGST